MTISLITANPDTSNPADFNVQADLAWQQLIVAIPEINSALEAFNFNATTQPATNLLISVASKTLTVQTSKSYVVGMAVTIAYTTDPTQWMRGEVTSYNSGTGEINVNVRYISDTTGTYTAWTISQASIESSVADSNILCVTGNGHGSTNTCIRLLTTTIYNTGTAFTVAHNATLGTYITINEPGIYSFTARDSRAGSLSPRVALTKNAATLNAASALADCIGYAAITSVGTNNDSGVLSVTDRFNTGDVIRLHDAGLNDGGAGSTSIWGRKIGNV